jgi:uncharacterized protein YoxC
MKGSVDELYTEIEQLSQAFEEINTQNTRLGQQVQQLEDTKTTLLAQQVRMKHADEQQKLLIDKSQVRIVGMCCACGTPRVHCVRWY